MEHLSSRHWTRSREGWRISDAQPHPSTRGSNEAQKSFEHELDVFWRLAPREVKQGVGKPVTQRCRQVWGGSGPRSNTEKQMRQDRYLLYLLAWELLSEAASFPTSQALLFIQRIDESRCEWAAAPQFTIWGESFASFLHDSPAPRSIN